MKTKILFALGSGTLLIALATSAAAQELTPNLPKGSFGWKYYRPTNTGIGGDTCEAIAIGADGNAWIGSYDPGWEEGGLAKFIYSQNRWENISNVDYPEIGHPEVTGTSRISDIDQDAQGRLWMATARGALFLDPAKGGKSLRRFGADNSPIPGGWNKGVEVAPDGTVWFSAYSTYWGDGGLSQYNPATNQWRVFPEYGGGPLAIQPKPGGGYYVWTEANEVVRFDSTTNAFTVFGKQNGNPAFVYGKNLTDSAGNTWMFKWTDISQNLFALDLRRPNGTWANVPEFPMGITISQLRALGPNQLLLADGGAGAWKFNGISWEYFGEWRDHTGTDDINIDASGNIWVCGIGGAARRDSGTGQWQRYRITNTSQFDNFNNDLALGPNGMVYATANAAAGFGGMVKFDGQRWTGYSNFSYGIGGEWPFDTDNSQSLYYRPSNGELIVNPMFHFTHSFDGANWTDLNMPYDVSRAYVEDSQNRLWTSNDGYVGYTTNGITWNQIEGLGASELMKDPIRPGTIWANRGDLIYKTNGTATVTYTAADFPQLNALSEPHLAGATVVADGTVWFAYNASLPAHSSGFVHYNPTTGATKVFGPAQGFKFPGSAIFILGNSPDGKVWFYFDDDNFFDPHRGMGWFDGKSSGYFEAPPNGEFVWDGLAHASIYDFEVQPTAKGYNIWLSTASRGLSVLKVNSTIKR